MAELATTDRRQELATTSEATAFVSMIERAATNPDVDVEKMERLYAMHEKMQARKAETTFAEAFAEMQPQLPAIAKKGKSHHGAYAKWEDIQDQVLPITSQYGFSISHKTKVEGGQVIVTGDRDHRAFQIPRHVFDEPGLATAGRPFQQQRKLIPVRGGEDLDFVADRLVVRFRGQQGRFRLYRGGRHLFRRRMG